MHTYADKGIRDECVGITNDADEKRGKRKVRMRMRIAAGCGCDDVWYEGLGGEAGQTGGASGARYMSVRRPVPHGHACTASNFPQQLFPHLEMQENRAREYGYEYATYASESESSVKRLLATLLCRPSESSLWFRGSTLGRLPCGTGGTVPSCRSDCERLSPSWAVADFRRLLRPLNSFDMRCRWDEEVSLRPSSELRLLRRSRAPSEALRKSSSLLSLLSLLAIETADDSGPLELARLTGAAKLLLERLAAIVLFQDPIQLQAQYMTVSHLSWRGFVERVEVGLAAGVRSIT